MLMEMPFLYIRYYHGATHYLPTHPAFMLKLPLLLVLRVRYLDLLGRVPRPRNLGRVPTGPHFFGEGELPNRWRPPSQISN